jgi:GT2 family glycosyltransferase
MGFRREKQKSAYERTIKSSTEFAIAHFDSKFYSEKYVDIGSSDPLSHYLMFGIRENRSPHPLVDNDFYLQNNPDVNGDPLSHYLTYGWKEGRTISPLIALSRFRELNRDWVLGSISPLQFLCEELSKGRNIECGGYSSSEMFSRPSSDSSKDLRDYVNNGIYMPTSKSVKMFDLDTEIWCAEDKEHLEVGPEDWARYVSVIIPIHTDHHVTRAMLRRLKSSSQNAGAEVIAVVNGCKDSEFVSSVLKLQGGNFKVIKVEEALGFAGAVNLGVINSNQKNEVLILNADVLARTQVFTLMYQSLISDSSIASVSAISNYGSVASYPIPNRETRYSCMNPDELSRRFETYVKSSHQIKSKTCFGHCVLIRRKAWQQIGDFDEVNFPSGYGEEVDWSIRCNDSKWGHVVAGNAFVWHEGSTSFGKRKIALKKIGEENLRSLHGVSYQDVLDFTPKTVSGLELAFVNLEFGLLSEIEGVERVLVVHNMGGGTFEFIHRNYELDQKTVLIFIDTESSTFSVQFEGSFQPNIDNHEIEIDHLSELLNIIHPAEVHVHTGVAKNSFALFAELLKVVAPQRFFLHDFSPFCPRINLVGGLSDSAKFCGGETDTAICNLCIEKHGSRTGVFDAASVRALAKEVFNLSLSIVVPSKSAQDIWRQWGIETSVFTHGEIPFDKDNVLQNRFEKNYLFNNKMRKSVHLTLNTVRERKRILIPGRISYEKGAELVGEVALLNRVKGSPFDLILCGKMDRRYQLIDDGFSMEIGDYAGSLPHVVAQLDTQLIWLPSIWPETHMYVIDDVLQLDSDIHFLINEEDGAPIHRLRNEYSKNVTTCTQNSLEVFRSMIEILGIPK